MKTCSLGCYDICSRADACEMPVVTSPRWVTSLLGGGVVNLLLDVAYDFLVLPSATLSLTLMSMDFPFVLSIG